MSNTPAARRSMLARSWRVVSALPRAYFRPVGQALDIPGIHRSWDTLRALQRQAFQSSNASVSGIRLIERAGRLDAEGTRAWMEGYARRQFEAGRATEEVLFIWETATPPEVVAWAFGEVRGNRLNVWLTMGKAAACGITAYLSTWLVTREDMALMSSIVLMLLFLFFTIAGVRGLKNQLYLESLLREDGE